MPRMQIGPYIDALQRDLAAVAAVGDAEANETVQRIAAALEASIRLRLLEAVTEAANELTSQLRSGHIEVRLVGGEPSLVYVEEAPEPGPAVAEDAFTARITLRLPESLKASLEITASTEGMSVNAWLVQAIARSLSAHEGPWGPRARHGRGRMTGFARS